MREHDEAALLRRTTEIAVDFLASLDTRPVAPAADYAASLRAFDGPLPDRPRAPADVVEELARLAEPGLMGTQSGRFFGFVIGGSLPAALAADWLCSTWDQNTGLAEVTPSTSAIEDVAGRWTAEVLGLPAGVSFAFVTGCQMAHVTALAAARHALYERAGWSIPDRGLAGAPPLRVVVGAKRHVTLGRALRLLGIGKEQEVVLPADSQGRMLVEGLAAALATDAPTIVCAQAGEVNTGAFDDLGAIADAAAQTGAWVHVDGAFGLWAAAYPRLAHLVAGHARADSWATDGHKWLNVPYDCGIAFCAHPTAHAAAMEYSAPY
ncbi:MAG: aspartate aminotransferase family protein, partial [Actinobacteria bacterium]|nr:aspartate aminotransferase family protein [Actinomycetota bacterium]